ncbi:O-antigen ligase family protein [Saccharopolyspora mangrovi]|uniref:O-antigen ligase family protein n=1 Tax=Saccharopolyspora mangrovi TaxID=3082379 RepID=A0ABU6A4F4_9PSEU|nr:O-antigen ligase family protein [Saccharopolyspora sp. S2-29]MEB3366458.1 O-antigen ligase family protein [Saccharopolyspora sp. S2-29]
MSTGLIVLFLNSKALKHLPISGSLLDDAPVLLGFVVGAMALVTICSRMRWLGGLAEVVVLFAFFTPAVLLSSFNEYGQAKVPAMFCVTGLAAVAAVTVIRTRARILWLLWWFALVGLAEVTLARLQSAGSGGVRLALDESNTIHLGRAAGAAALAILVLVLHLYRRRPRGWVWAVVACGMAVVYLAASTVASGSRGPLVALVATVCLVALMMPAKFVVRSTRLALTVAVFVGFTLWALSQAPEASANRITDLLGGQQDSSTLARTHLYAATLPIVAMNPFGIGWGDLSEKLPSWAWLDSGVHQYPHNLFVEVAAEGGWIAAAALIVVVAVAFGRARAQLPRLEGVGITALLCFFLLNVSVSGDLVANQAFFVLLGVALAFPAVRRDRSLGRPESSAPTSMPGTTYAGGGCGGRAPW